MIAGRQRRRVRIAQQVAREELRDRALSGDLLPRQTLTSGASPGGGALRVVLARIISDVLAVAFLVERHPLRASRLRALCRYANDAVRRLRSIQGGCGRTLDDLHALDLVRIDVIEKRWLAAAAEHRQVR